MLILRLFIELLPLLALGYLIGYLKPGISSKIAQPLIDFGVPASLMGLLLKSGGGLARDVFEAFLITLLAIGLMLAIARSFPKTRKLLGHRSFLLGSVFGNSGYLGIPISLALLPSQALSFSIGYDLGTTFLIWSLGPMLVENSSLELKGIACCQDLFYVFMRTPATKGLVGALMIQLTPWTEQITSALWIPSRLVILLALLIVGIQLGSFNFSIKQITRKFWLSLHLSFFIKLIIFPSLMLVISKAFSISTLMRNALILQSAMPTAISVLLLAESKACEDEQQVAVLLVALGTLIALGTVPIWFLVLQWTT